MAKILTPTQIWNRIFNPTSESIATFLEDIRVKRIDDEGSLVFEGWAKDLNAAATDPVWLIKRTALFGNETLEEWADVAGVKGKYTGIWTSKGSYFTGAPFANTYSVAFFSAANNYITIPHHADLDFTNIEPFTILLWAKSTNSGSTQTILEKFTGGFGYTLDHTSAGQIQFNFQGGAAGNRIRIREDIALLTSANLWNLIGITYDGSGLASGLRLYVNATEAGRNILNDTLTVSPANAAALVFGSSSSGGAPRFNGFIDEPAFFNSRLTQAEILEIYNAGSHIDLTANFGDYVSSGNLLSQWRFGDGDTYPTVIDQVSAHNGTMTNMGAGNFSLETP